MIAVKNPKNLPCKVINKKTDIIIIQTIEKQEIDEKGRKIITQTQKPINLTKQINETAKLVKQNSIYSAEDKLNELKRVINK